MAIAELEVRRSEIMPPYLAHVPMPAKRQALLSFGEILTGAHESQHGLVTRAKGATVLWMSIEPTKDYLGVTIVGGVSGDLLKLQSISAGGAVDTPYGSASGDGSDRGKAASIAHTHGRTIESAIAEASGIITSYHLEVRKRLAEIVAFMKNLTGFEFELAIKRAQWEVAQEKGQKYEFTPVLIPAPIQEFEHVAVIGTRHDGSKDIKVIEASKFCLSCHGIEAHRIDCQLLYNL